MQKDSNLQMIDKTTISDVSSYIQTIKKLIDINKNDNITFLYRGESEIFPTFCRPNIFRRNVLQSNPYYEKSLFNTMRQNRLSNNTSYLENAIDAQHGEFPSRLLDVSYNCLNALYFAVTPYYHDKITDLDNKDGMVFIFYIEDIFSPSAENTNDNYNAIINKDKSWFNDSVIFSKNHKFIDHAKINNRIIAQQGAFILFQGNDAEDIPAYMMNGILIPKEVKPTIREELSLMFGINTGSIYPEIVNLAEDLVQKSKCLVTENFSQNNELKYVMKNLKKELSYYEKYLFDFDKANKTAYFEAVQLVEIIINSYRIGLIDFFEKTPQDISNEKQKWVAEYNEIVKKFAANMDMFCKTIISANLYIE